MRIAIIGAGPAGIMACGGVPGCSGLWVFDSRTSLSNDHQAVFRLRDPRVALLLGCHAREAKVTKEILVPPSDAHKGWFQGQLTRTPLVNLANLYSKKVYGQINAASISKELGEVTRYLTDRSSMRVPEGSHLGHTLIMVRTGPRLVFESKDRKLIDVDYDFAISTIPLPVLITCLPTAWYESASKSLKESNSSFKSEPVYVYRGKTLIPATVNQTIYVPDPHTNISRMTLQESELIIESVGQLGEDQLIEAAEVFGLWNAEVQFNPNPFVQPMGKLLPISEDLRKLLIVEITEQFNIFSLGRFATWRPLRTDQLLGDIDQINRLISLSESQRKYEIRRAG